MNGNGLPLLAQAGPGMQAAAQQGMINAPQAGSYPQAVPAQPTYGAATSVAPTAGGPINVTQPPVVNQPNSGASNNPYQSFIQALQQIQQTNPVQAIQNVTPPARMSAASQQAKMHETGVG